VSNYKQSSPLVNQSLLNLGLISFNLGNQEAAVNYYKQVFSNNPTAEESERARENLREIYVDKMGRPDLFFQFFETLPGQEVNADGREAITFQAARSQYENGNYDRAISALTDYLRQYPNTPNALAATYFRGDSYVATQRYNEALADFERVASSGPSGYYLPALNKGSLIAYRHVQDYDRSFRLFQGLEAAAPSDDIRVDAQVGVMQSAYQLNNQRSVEDYAAKVANNSRASSTQRLIANFYIGKIAYDRRDYRTALPALNQVIANSDDERTAEARYLRANIAYLNNELSKAVDLALEANRESSGYPYWVAKTVLVLSDALKDQGGDNLYNSEAALEALLDNYDGDAAIVAEAQQRLTVVRNLIAAGSRINNTPVDPNRFEIDNGGGK